MISPKKNPDMRFVRIDLVIVGIVLLLACALRLYRINAPLADWHSWRQADTAAVARNFASDGFDLLRPRYDDLSNVQSGKYNPQGYRMVEFPLYNAAVGALSKISPSVPIEIYGRSVSVFFSLILIVCLYYLALKEEGRVAAFFAALVFSVMPFFVYYSRVVLPEMTALSLMFIGITSLSIWKERKNNTASTQILFILSAVTTAASLLIKPTTIFFLLPLVYLLFQKWSFSLIKKIGFYMYFFIILAPFIAWRIWILNFPEGIPVTGWLITSVNTFEGQKNIFFKPAFFRWLFYERVATLISGGYLMTLVLVGVIRKPKKSLLLLLIGFATLAYVLVFQGGNVQHDYYQTLILPALTLFAGMGAQLLIQEKKLFINPVVSTIMVLIIIIAAGGFSFYKVKDYYNYDASLVNIAKIVSTITEPQSIIVTDREGDTTLLYLSDRKGYPSISEDLSGLKNRGAQYFVTLRKDSADNARKTYQAVFESDQVYIFKL